MIPRTAQMAKVVENILSTSEIDDYGNIILNGYATTGPNTANIKAWQYHETTTAPVNLPSITTYQPMLRGWTTNYMSYFTRPESGYSLYTGQENPLLFDIWNFYQTPGAVGATGPVTSIAINVGNSDAYIPGTYLISATGGPGSGLVCEIIVTPGGALGVVSAVNVVNGGTGYAVGDFPIEFYSLPYDPILSPSRPAQKFTVATIGSDDVIPAAGYSQCPKRFFQNQTSQVTLPQNQNNSQVIPYSFLYPVQTLQTAPPLDYVAP